MPTDVVVVLCTMPSGDAASAIARTLVEERLAACVNLVPGVRSIYVWKGVLTDETEQLAIIKTTALGFGALRDRLVQLHPAEVPEIIALDLHDIHLPYLRWVREQVDR
jgi:periplasmic divalent cation tolerance protein